MAHLTALLFAKTIFGSRLKLNSLVPTSKEGQFMVSD